MVFMHSLGFRSWSIGKPRGVTQPKSTELFIVKTRCQFRARCQRNDLTKSSQYFYVSQDLIMSITSKMNLDTQACLPCTHLYAYIVIDNQQVNYMIMGTIHIITVKYTDTVLQRGNINQCSLEYDKTSTL